MAHKHIEDRRAYQRGYYQTHREQINANWRRWYEKHKNDPEFKERRRVYKREWYRRKRFGL